MILYIGFGKILFIGDSFSYILDSMQKLKRAYPELQSDAKNNFDKVTM